MECILSQGGLLLGMGPWSLSKVLVVAIGWMCGLVDCACLLTVTSIHSSGGGPLVACGFATKAYVLDAGLCASHLAPGASLT